VWRGYFRPYVALNEKERERGGSVEVLVWTGCNIKREGKGKRRECGGLV